MATILLSIKPEYVAKIFDHTKLYEFRKRIPQRPVDKVVVYSSNPEQHIVGEFEVLETIKMKPSPLWETTKSAAGITRKLNDFGISNPPQSFIYLKNC